MSPESRALFLAILAAALPSSIRRKASSLTHQSAHESRLQLAWRVLGISLSVHVLRHTWIDFWQCGLRGLLLRGGRECLRVALSLPGVRGFVEKEVRKELSAIEKKMHGNGDASAILSLPDESLPCSSILNTIHSIQATDAAELATSRKKWSGIYHSPTGELVDLQNAVWGAYNCTNTLYEGVFPSVRKFEAEVISWVVHLLQGKAGSCGLMTSGGTESVMIAALAYRERGRQRGIAKPRVIAANTCHPAIAKACHYFGMELTKIPVSSSTGFALTAAAVRAYVTGDVVCIYASAPTFSHGVIDHVEDLGKLAQSKGVGLHVDNCLGGVLLSYMDMQALTEHHQMWDFRAAGVTSISTDIHKYGNASKGVSVVAFSDESLRSLTFVPVTDGCEGLYVTPTMQGSRSGAVIAQAWATMLKYGNDGYKEMAATIHKLHVQYQDVVKRIPGLHILCRCHVSIVPIVSDKYNIYCVASLMEESGWNLFTGQNPPVLSICLGEQHAQLLEDFEQDLQSAIAVLDKDPQYKPKGTAAVYGAMPTTPVAVLEQVVCKYLDIRMSVRPQSSTT